MVVCLNCINWQHNPGFCTDGYCQLFEKDTKSYDTCEQGTYKDNVMPLNIHTPGAKDDSVKPRTDLVLGGFSRALWEVSQVGTFGANKYTDNGWMEVPNGIERYLNALLRHYFKYRMGEVYDPESGLLHLSHLAWNSLAVLELYSRESEGTVNG